MFKTLFNSRLIVLIFIFVISLISCDGRDRKYMNNTEILQENNLLNKFSEQVKFVPNAPVAINTDTILSNGFNVKINYRSIENNAFYKVTKKEKDSIIKMNYKNFEAHIEVFKDDTPINQSTINKLLFSEEKIQIIYLFKAFFYIFIWSSSLKEDHYSLKMAVTIGHS